MGKYVAYYRVSTRQQGTSGLGIEGQQAAVAAFLKPNDTVIATFTEVESGKNSERAQLGAAIRAARLHRATLLIAKLDRLSRNVAFLAQLLDGDVAITACDNPTASKFTLHILAAVAEHEAAMISTRTKAALAAAKARGVALGGWKGKPMAKAVRDKGTATVASQAQERATTFAPLIAELRESGVTSTIALADALNRQAIPTARGGKWHAASVARMLHRIA